MKKRKSIQIQRNIGVSLGPWQVGDMTIDDCLDLHFDRLFFFSFFWVFSVGALLGICGTAFSFYNRNDLLSDINKEFIVIRSDTKSIDEKIQLLLAEQRDILRMQQQQLEQKQQQRQRDRNNSQNDESWAHWIARQTYVISIYRYFVPKTVS